MNRSDLIARMTERLGGDRASAVVAVNGVLEEIEAGVARGERVTLSGFGTFDRRARAARMARNPRTGDAVRVDATVVPVFRAATGFKSLVHHPDGSSEPPVIAAASVPASADTGAPSAVATADGKKTKKKLRKAAEQAAEKDGAAAKAGKKARKAAKRGKAGKKTA